MSLQSIFSKFLLLLFFCISTEAVLLAQKDGNITFLSWEKELGLPSNNISAVEKDELGFLWIATNDGLCRFDGPNLIKIYRQTKEGQVASNSLQSNNIRTLFSDSKGFLWIGTRFGGLTRFHPASNTWTTFRHDPAQTNSLSNDEVLVIMEDTRHRIWVGTEGGLNLFDRKTATFTRYLLRQNQQENSNPKAVLSLMEDNRGWIWAGTWADGLYLLLADEKGQISEQQARHFQTTSDKVANNVWSLFQDNGDRFWIGTHGGGLLLMNFPKNATNTLGKQDWEPTYNVYRSENKNNTNLESNAIQVILQDQLNDLWLGTTNGLHKIHSNNLPPLNTKEEVTLAFKPYLSFEEKASTIIGNNIMDLLEDEQGLIWIATSNGLSQFNRNSNLLKSFDFPIAHNNIPFAPNLILDQENNIWVGTREKGIINLRLEYNQLVPSKRDINPLILGKEIGTIHSPEGKNLYVGTESGITKINLKTSEARKYPVPAWVHSLVQKLKTTCILVDKDDFIWLGTKVGLFRINPTSKEYTLFEPEKDNPNSIGDRSINHIIQDRQGAIWIGTYRGLYRVKSHKEDQEVVFEQFLYNDKDPSKGPLTNEIMYLKEVGNYLYIGTLSGLGRFSFTHEVFESFALDRYKHWVHSIEEGNDKNLWISTNEGILNFDTQKSTFRFFDKKDGLKVPEFQLGCSFKDPKGQIYFAYSYGLTYFLPEEMRGNQIAPPVFITAIEKMTDKGVFLNDGVLTEEIILEHNEYRISFEIAALNYNRPDKNKYAYRLVGLEDHWNKGKSGVPIVYTNLAPQTYQLEVKAANNDGIWNEKGAALKIIQKAPFWKTWWFFLLTFSLIVAAVLSITSWYTNNIRKHNEQLQEYNKNLNEEIANRKRVELQLQDYNNELKQSNKDLEQFAYIASHDLKEPLRVIGNFSGLLSRRYGQNLDKNALEYIGFIQNGVKRMSKLVYSLLTFSTVGRKDIVYSSVDLNNLLGEKIADLTQVVLERNALIKAEILPKIFAQEEQIGMVFLNLIQNALKYNTSKQPSVLIKEEKGDDQFWKFSVSDNGIGIPDQYQERIFEIFKRLHGKGEYEGTGIGLSVCQKIILRHQGNIWFESEVGKGTTFFFTIKKGLSMTSTQEAKEEIMELAQHS